MSYILDALKKSEQERGAGKIPDVQTVHSASLSYRQEQKPWWPYVLVLAVLLNLAAIVYFNLDRPSSVSEQPPSSQPAHAQTTTPQAAKSPDPAPAGSRALADKPREKTGKQAFTTNAASTPPASGASSVIQESPGKQATTSPAQATPVRQTDSIGNVVPDGTENDRPQPPATTSQQRILDFDELPEHIRQDLPVLLISAHVYSSNPLQRSIVINNNFMEEGEYVLDGLVLYEITPQGAIFAYRDYLFHYPVVSGWQ